MWSNPSPGGSGTAAVRKRPCRVRQPISCSTVFLTTVVPSATPAAHLPVQNPVHDRAVSSRAASLHRSRRAETSGTGDGHRTHAHVNGRSSSADSRQPAFYLTRPRYARFSQPTRSSQSLGQRRIHHGQGVFPVALVLRVVSSNPVPAANDRQAAQLVGSPARPDNIARDTPPALPVVRRVFLRFFYDLHAGQHGKLREHTSSARIQI